MDITQKIKSASLLTKTSKAGNEYQVLHIVFQNGYKFEPFLKDEQAFIIESIE